MITLRSLAALAILTACGGGSAPPCPNVSGTWNVTGALASDNTCTSNVSFGVAQSVCLASFSSGSAPDGGTASPVFSCMVAADGRCMTTAGAVTIDGTFSATSGSVMQTSGGTTCTSTWVR